LEENYNDSNDHHEEKEVSKPQKLIITVTPNPSWIYPETKNHPTTPDEIADCVYDCYKAGASIAHLHAPGKQIETSKKIRDKCDIIIQFGLSGEPLEKRRALFEGHPDMISIILTHHDEQFTNESFNILHEKGELEEYERLCLKYNVKPEFEVWHLGAIWNLIYLQKKGLVKAPYFLTNFFGWPGGSWSPPTAEEFFHRIRYMPPGSIYSTSVMNSNQTELLLLAIVNGGHVRVGTEDYPFLSSDTLAENNCALVSKIAKLAREAGREIASAKEAREIIGI
jgi:3-keto-5-aminohexanoate cleavage enzyme